MIMVWTYYFQIFLLLSTVLVDCKTKKKLEPVSASSSFLFQESGSPSLYEYETADSNTLFHLSGEFMKQFAFQAASVDTSKSMVCSPLSAILPLTKLSFAAKGESLRELYEAIGVTNMEQVKKRFKSILKNLRNLPGVTVAIASRIYVNKEKKLHKKFAHKAENVLRYGIESLDMKDPLAVANNINAWVQSQTKGIITHIIRPTDLANDTNLLVINAIHFKGQWEHPFESVMSGIFYGPAGERAVSMMNVINDFDFAHSSILDSKVILIPYKQSKANMMIVLPKSKQGLPLLLQQLRIAPQILATLQLNKTKVNLSIPKFSIESNIDLIQAYKWVGLSAIFSKYYGFEELVKVRKETNKGNKRQREKERVVLDRGKHTAVIEVTEEGTTGVAASSSFRVKHTFGLRHEEMISFEASHPFLYFIIADHEQLFAGIFTAA